jgi:capsular exopolysaccharide synthesis family protein
MQQGQEITAYRRSAGGLSSATVAGPSIEASDDLLRVLWRRRWSGLAIMALCLAAAAAYLFWTTPLYTATAQLYIQQTGPELNPGADPDARAKNYLQSQCEVIKAAPLLGGVLDRTDVRSMRTFQGVPNRLAFFKEQLSAEVGRKNDIVVVSMDSPWPAEAELLVKYVVDAYIAQQAAQKRNTASEMVKILYKEQERREAELAEKLKAMLAFKQANATLSFADDRGNITIQRLARLSEALTTAQLETVEATAAADAARLAAAQPEQMRRLIAAHRAKGIVSAMDREEEQLRAQLVEMEVRLGTARGQLGSEHPTVRTTQNYIDQLRQKIAQRQQEFTAMYLLGVENDAATARQREQALQTSFLEQRKQALDLNSKASDYAVLEAEVQQATKLCENLQLRIKDLKVAANTGGMNIEILEPAIVSDRPTKPRRSLVLMGALVAGGMLGLVTALVRSALDQRLRVVDEVQSTLRLPLVCAVPHITGASTAAQRGRAVLLAPMSEVAETYRNLRTAIYFTMHNGHSRSLLVTSPERGDGKSTVAANLAIAMAQAGDRVLLLDADLRRPAQHTVFGLSNDTGLSTVLALRRPTAEAIRATAVQGLDVLTCGVLPPNPAEILHGEEFQQLLNDMGSVYDRIVIDSPPVILADARILASMCDGTLLVLRAHKSTRRGSEAACHHLAGAGARLVGAVINDVRSQEQKYRYVPQQEALPAEAAVEPVAASAPVLSDVSDIGVEILASTSAPGRSRKRPRRN